ncbi:MAG: antitermination protein NusG [Bdellovibrionales bacterium RBG_16_40_8]|nr:MAG: antitermination protein NusG [Bdellovibrionales bacterium RBG_16_40_8]
MELLLSEGALLIARWIHFLSGVVWIGVLYYFNFIQGSFFSEVDANTKNIAISKLVPRALWWFRYGALYTWLSGLYIIMARGHMAGFGIYSTSWGISILIGTLLGTFMFLNVWLIIWPNQKVVIQSATQVLSGQSPLVDAAACGARAGLASRHNTLFSIPLLLFMAMASHMSFSVSGASHFTLWLIVIAIVGALEFNAIKGKLGPITTVRGVIISGFVLTAVLYVAMRMFS